jgi:hypothetical protein
LRALGRLAISAAVLSSIVLARPAQAEEQETDFGDGITACDEFDAKNERELAEWTKQQPKVPYVYPREGKVLGAPWGPLFKNIGSSGALLAATLIPHVGAQLRAETPAAVVSWPWSFPLGPASTCSRKRGVFVLNKHKPHRLLLEPGIVSSNRGVGFFTRPGYRYIHHPSDWVVGVGGGLGTTIELSGNREPTRASLGPEGVLHFGRCCGPSYFTLALRYDHFFAGEVRDLVSTSLGYTFF